MKGIKKSGFTLVELIVVITILAILGTIAFISLQGYTSDARNAKRTDDIGSIESAMNNLMAGGQNIASFVVTNGDNKLSTISIGGETPATDEYDAGTPNFASLGINEAEFKDPKGKDYVVGVTTKRGGKYQISATMENGAGPLMAKLKGNYFARGVDTAAVSAGTDGKSLTITDQTKVNFFDIGDKTGVGKIVNIKTGSNLIFGSGITAPTTLALSEKESDGLIASVASITGNSSVAGQAVVDDGQNVAYAY